MLDSIGRIYYSSIDLQQLQLIDLTYMLKKGRVIGIGELSNMMIIM